MTYENIRIVQFPKSEQVAVYDGDVLINKGDRPVDVNFAHRIQTLATRQGFCPVTVGLETTFKKVS